MHNKVTLFLMTQKGFAVLQQLIAHQFRDLLHLVVIGKDADVKNDFSEEILKICNENNLPFIIANKIESVTTPFALAISWRWIINTGTATLIVLHDSLLPKYRGFSPLVTQLLNFEKHIGVTAIVANQQYDAGPIIFQQKIEINYPIKIQDAIQILLPLYQDISNQLFSGIKNNLPFKMHQQNESEASYCLWRDEFDYAINWNNSAQHIIQFINSLGPPYAGAFTCENDKAISILEAQIVEDVLIENRMTGKVLFVEQKLPIVVCGIGLLKITHAIDRISGKSILPLKNFRVRFQ